MGIRFLCPECGHKLNVKSFLSGKRGVCPQCSSGLDIPLESQITKGGDPAQPTLPTDAESAQRLADSPVPTTPAVTPTSSRPAAASPELEFPVHPQPGKPDPAAQAGASSSPGYGTPAASPTPLTAPLITPLTVPTRPLMPVQPAAPVAPEPEPQPPDPIEDAPDAIWYVRPPSGGQYGPARGDVLRKWIGEGRVSSDSLVWREGWDDWLTAGDILPSLGANVTPPIPGPAAPTAYLASPRPSEARTAVLSRRKNSAALAISAVAVLGLVCVALFITLVFILMK